MGFYDFYREYCVCPGQQVPLGMRDLDENEVTSFPVNVYNINEEFIGEAATKQEYIGVWNSDPDNQVIGTLGNHIGPFLFMLYVNSEQTAPEWVIGDPGEIPEGIYATEYDSYYE